MLLLFVIGILIRATCNGNKELEFRIDDRCTDGVMCHIEFTIKEEIKGPVYVYLHYTNFFLNHRRVMRSFNKDQMKGAIPTQTSIDNTCLNMQWNKDSGHIQGIAGNALVPEDPLYPCGILPNLYVKGTQAVTETRLR